MRIVTLGGGTGQATVLRGLRAYDCQLTAIVGVTDNGGHSGQLRHALRMPQVGDTRQCLGALVDDSMLWEPLLQHRFTEGMLAGASVGNVVLAALSATHGSLATAVEVVSRAAQVTHRVLPVSDADTQIAAELSDGREVVGEWEIMQRSPRSDVRRLFLCPASVALPAVVEAIAAADVLLLCPGSFLTGTLAVLLHSGVHEAMAASPARCLYICNMMTQPGQTDGWTAGKHLEVLHEYLGRQVDGMVLNTGVLPADLLADYVQHGYQPVVNDLDETICQVYTADLVEQPDAATIQAYRRPQGQGMAVGLHLIRHDAYKLAAYLMTLFSTEGERHRC